MSDPTWGDVTFLPDSETLRQNGASSETVAHVIQKLASGWDELRMNISAGTVPMPLHSNTGAAGAIFSQGGMTSSGANPFGAHVPRTPTNTCPQCNQQVATFELVDVPDPDNPGKTIWRGCFGCHSKLCEQAGPALAIQRERDLLRMLLREAYEHLRLSTLAGKTTLQLDIETALSAKHRMLAEQTPAAVLTAGGLDAAFEIALHPLEAYVTLRERPRVLAILRQHYRLAEQLQAAAILLLHHYLSEKHTYLTLYRHPASDSKTQPKKLILLVRCALSDARESVERFVQEWWHAPTGTSPAKRVELLFEGGTGESTIEARTA